MFLVYTSGRSTKANDHSKYGYKHVSGLMLALQYMSPERKLSFFLLKKRMSLFLSCVHFYIYALQASLFSWVCVLFSR